MSQNNKQSAAGLFLSFFLKATVIILGLVILAMAAYLIKASMANKSVEKEKKADNSAFEDNQTDELLENKATNTDALLYENAEAASEEAKNDGSLSKDASIVVLNATDVPGVAGKWKDKLVEAGYTNVQAGDYTKGILDISKIVVVTEGTGTALQEFLPEAKMETLPANEVQCSVNTEGVEAFLIIGTPDVVY